MLFFYLFAEGYICVTTLNYEIFLGYLNIALLRFQQTGQHINDLGSLSAQCNQ